MVYLIVFIILGAFVGVVVMIAKKDGAETKEMVENLTEEQKNRLMAAEVTFVEQNAWTQDAMVAKIKDKGGKVDVRLLWYNTTIQNAEMNTITIADASIKKSEQEEHDLKVGDFVKLYIAPEKTVGSVKIVF
jgi:hypothetical protein